MINKENRVIKRSHCNKQWCLCIVLLIGCCWSAALFYSVNPYPVRWMSDDLQYLLVAKHIAHSGRPVMNLATELYGGDFQNMIKIGKPAPQYNHLLGYHFPSYSYFLAGFLYLFKNDFWAVATAHSLLFTGILWLTYTFTLHLANSVPAAFFAALGACFSPTLSMYLPITMMELFCVFLAMLSMYFFLRPDTSLNNLMLGLVLSVLVLSRNTFLVFVVLYSVFCFFDRERTFKTSHLFITILPVLSVFGLGANGFLYYHLGHHPNTMLDTVNTIQQNARLIFKYRFSLTGHPLYETYFYVGILTMIVSLLKYRNKPLIFIVCLAHAVILSAVFFRYDWFDWRHIRVSMWFVPFTYCIVMTLLMDLKSAYLKGAVTAVLILLVLSGVYANKTLLVKTNKTEKTNAGYNITRSKELVDYIDKQYNDAKFVAIPHEFISSALYDPGRIYYASWPGHIGNSLLFKKDPGLALDVAFLTPFELRQLAFHPDIKMDASYWSEVYSIKKDGILNLNILVKGNIVY